MRSTFITPIPQPCDESRSSGEWFRERLGEAGISLTEGGELMHGDKLIGCYQFLELAEGRRFMPLSTLPLVDTPIPYRGSAQGYFCWTHVADQTLAEQHLLPGIVTCSHGIVVRVDNGRYKQVVRMVEFPMSNLVGNHGFADGEALLNRSSEYLAYVQHEAKSALAAVGLSGEIARFDSHHNPIRLVGELLKQGYEVEQPEMELARYSLKIWAHDLDALADLEFWID